MAVCEATETNCSEVRPIPQENIAVVSLGLTSQLRHSWKGISIWQKPGGSINKT